MKEKITYKGYSMYIDGPNPKDGSYGGTFKYPGTSCVVSGQTLKEAIKDFEQFVDERLNDLKQEKHKVENVSVHKMKSKTTIEYMGIVGSVEIDSENKGFMGNIIKASNKYIYRGKTYEEFISDFHLKVEKYCNDLKKDDKNLLQYKGSFNVRVSPSVHRDASEYAKDNHISLNKLVEAAIIEKIYAQ